MGTALDPLLGIVLDTTKTGDNRNLSLTVNFTPVFGFETHADGNFNFDATGYQNLSIGFQLNTKGGFLDPNPDWFVISLADPAGQGSFDSDALFGFSVSDPIKYAVLYGTQIPPNGAGPGETPLPGAVWLFGTVLAGFGGYLKFGKRAPVVHNMTPA